MSTEDTRSESTNVNEALGRIFYFLVNATNEMACAGNADVEQVRRNAETIMKIRDSLAKSLILLR